MTGELRDPKIEEWLTGYSVEFCFESELDLGRVNVQASRANQARLEAVDEEVVARYAEDMARGDQFPPIVVHRASRKRKATILGGNHRHAAALKAGLSTLPAYVVSAEPEMVLRLTYEDNRRHGLPPSDEERIAQAVHLMDTGYSQEEAARVVGVTAGKVSRARAVVAADRRAEDLGVDGFGVLPRSSRSRLASVRSDPVFVEASKLVLAARLDTQQAYDLVTRINDARSDKAALGVVGAEQETHRSTIQAKAGQSRGPRTSRASKVNDALFRLIDAKPSEVRALCATPEQREAMAERVRKAAKNLMAVGKALER